MIVMIVIHGPNERGLVHPLRGERQQLGETHSVREC